MDAGELRFVRDVHSIAVHAREWLPPLHWAYRELGDVATNLYYLVVIDWFITWFVVVTLAIAAFLALSELGIRADSLAVSLCHGATLEQVERVASWRMHVERARQVALHYSARIAQPGLAAAEEPDQLAKFTSRSSSRRALYRYLVLSATSSLAFVVRFALLMVTPFPANLLVWVLVLSVGLPLSDVDRASAWLAQHWPHRWNWFDPTFVVAGATLLCSLLAILIVTNVRAKAEYHKQVYVRNRDSLAILALEIGRLASELRTFRRDAARAYSRRLLREFVEVQSNGLMIPGDREWHRVERDPARWRHHRRPDERFIVHLLDRESVYRPEWEPDDLRKISERLTLIETTIGRITTKLDMVHAEGNYDQFLRTTPRLNRQLLNDFRLGYSRVLSNSRRLSPNSMSSFVQGCLADGAELRDYYARSTDPSDSEAREREDALRASAEVLADEIRERVYEVALDTRRLEFFQASVTKGRQWTAKDRLRALIGM